MKGLDPTLQFGILSREGLTQLIDDNIDYNMLRSFGGNVYATCVHFPTLAQGEVVYFNLPEFSDDEIKKRLLASAAIPVVFGRVYIDDEPYWDGGIPVFGDNVPIKPLYDDGIRTFVVVHLSADNIIDRAAYPDATIIEIMPSEYLGGALNGTMHFSPEYAKRIMELGYCDTVRLLEPLYRMGLANRKYAEALRQLKMNTDEFYKKHLEFDAEFDYVQNSIDKKNLQLQMFINRR